VLQSLYLGESGDRENYYRKM